MRSNVNGNPEQTLEKAITALSENLAQLEVGVEDYQKHVKRSIKSSIRGLEVTDPNSVSRFITLFQNKLLKEGKTVPDDVLNYVLRIDRYSTHLSKQSGYIDQLTGLYNRKSLEDQIGRQLRQTRREGSPFSFIFYDLDNLKELNDRFGHHVGDQALREVGTAALSSFRPSDFPARYGGDEFAVLLPSTNIEEAHVAAERFKNMLAGKNISFQVKKGKSGVSYSTVVSVSMGVISIGMDDGILLLYDDAGRELVSSYIAARDSFGGGGVDRLIADYLNSFDSGAYYKVNPKKKPERDRLKIELEEIADITLKYTEEHPNVKKAFGNLKTMLLKEYTNIGIYAVLHRADDLLYNSKKQGKNTISIENPSPNLN